MAISISKFSLAPFSKINICPESSLYVDIGKTLVPKDTIKNSASTLVRFTERVESHLFVTWKPSYSKMYLVRFSVVHQSNSFTMILCSLGFFMPCWKSMKLALLWRLDALIQKLIFGNQKQIAFVSGLYSVFSLVLGDVHLGCLLMRRLLIKVDGLTRQLGLFRNQLSNSVEMYTYRSEHFLQK